MAEPPAPKDADAESTLCKWTRKVPEEVVEVARIAGTWVFNIKFKESVIPPSLFIPDNRDDQLALASAKFFDIVWEEQWMQDIPEDLGRDGILELARTLETMIDAREDVFWSPESSSYAVGDDRRRHICLERVCVDSRGTQCPRFAIGEISQQLADEISTNDNGRAEKIDAAKHLGEVVQDTYNSYPNDPGRMTAAILDLHASDNPFRQLMRA